MRRLENGHMCVVAVGVGRAKTLENALEEDLTKLVMLSFSCTEK